MTRRLLFALCAGVALLAVCQPDLMAGKPAPPPPPPPPPVNPTLIYEWRADLGGWLDKERNLIWGTYSITAAVGGSMGYDYSVNAATNYADTLAAGAVTFEDQRIHYLALGDQYSATDAARAARYYQLAADNGFAADELLENALGAANVEGSNVWRMPSKNEFIDAYNRRFFSYGADGLNALDLSPLPGLQQQTAYLLYWTTTQDKGNRSQWAYNPPTGALQSVLKDGSYLYGVAVRNYTPPVLP